MMEFQNIIEHADKAKNFDGEVEVLRFARVADGFINAQRRMEANAIITGVLGFVAGFGVCAVVLLVLGVI